MFVVSVVCCQVAVLCRADHSSRGVPPSVCVCVCVSVKTRGGGPDPLGAVEMGRGGEWKRKSKVLSHAYWSYTKLGSNTRVNLLQLMCFLYCNIIINFEAIFMILDVVV
jgi:hypothetical protein